MSKRNRTVASRTHRASGDASGRQIKGDTSRANAFEMVADGARQRQGVLTPDEVDQQIRRFFESGHA